MSYPQILLLSVGLAMDAMAVAAARGSSNRVSHGADVLLLAGLFGGAQALMPLLGWLIGSEIGSWVSAFDHWFAFVVLSALGVKMLREARQVEPTPAHSAAGLSTLLALAVATSIDAFAAGMTLSVLDAPFVLSIVTIGVVTAVLSAIGAVLGRRFGDKLGRRLDAFGGVVLIAIGCKILIEHLSTH